MDESFGDVEGFSWKGDIERDTVGILVWSQPFIVDEVRFCIFISL
jgi:hypothetical protein